MNSFSYFKRIMKNRFLTGMIILVGIATSCNEDIVLFEVDCSECYIQRPEYVPMTIKLTINDENPQVPLTIYLGEYEKDQIRIEDTAYYSVISVDLIPSRYYSVRAEYHVGGNTVYAVDGDEIDLAKVSSQCDSVCWIIRGGEIDVRLKYQDPDDLPK